MFRTVSQEPQPQCLGKSLEQIHSSSQPVSRHRQAESEGDAIRPIARESQVVPGDDDKDVQREEMEIEEPLEARIERLGRQRPAVFHSIWKEIAFVFSINMSMLLSEYFISGFNVILPTLMTDLHIPPASSVWPASAFSLVVASTLLVFGRLADMFGGYPVFMFGLAWLLGWSIIAGFSQNELMLDFCRALQGLGPAAFLPSGVMLMGSIYRPGPRKNLVFSIYGLMAVVGFFVGIFFSGIVGQYIHWGWYFWIGAGLTAITIVSSYLSIPSDSAQRRKQGIKMDYMGAMLIVSGLVLTVFAITDSAHAPHQWRTPYIYVVFVIGCLLLGVAIYAEGWVAEMPLLPFDLFSVPHMKPLVVALVFVYGGIGVWLLYGTLYMQNIMGATPLQVVAWFTPTIIGGMILNTAGGFVFHLIPGTGLLLFSGIGWVGSTLFFAVMPKGASYWAFVFPSAICATIGIDITFNITTIFITTSMTSERQGLAGALINSIYHLGIAVLLGISDIIQTNTAHLGLRKSYKGVFWFGVGCGVMALILMIFFVKLEPAKSDLTADEKRDLEKAASAEQAAELSPKIS